MKAFKLFFIILMFPIGLFAQSETMPVILVSADGKVTYQDNSKLNVIPGSIMKNPEAS